MYCLNNLNTFKNYYFLIFMVEGPLCLFLCINLTLSSRKRKWVKMWRVSCFKEAAAKDYCEAEQCNFNQTLPVYLVGFHQPEEMDFNSKQSYFFLHTIYIDELILACTYSLSLTYRDELLNWKLSAVCAIIVELHIIASSSLHRINQ